MCNAQKAEKDNIETVLYATSKCVVINIWIIYQYII